jgi:hypothetical protein
MALPDESGILIESPQFFESSLSSKCSHETQKKSRHTITESFFVFKN